MLDWAAIGSALLTLAPSLISTFGPLLFGTSTQQSSSSAQAQMGQSSTVGSTESTSSSTSAGSTVSSSQEQQQVYSGQTGSTAGVSGALGTAMSTPTANNSNTAAWFNAGAAILGTVFDLFTWNQANKMSQQAAFQQHTWDVEAQTSAQSFSAAQAQLGRDWQEQMRKTAYQDTMADMEAAGLNPILAASNGATSTPGTSAPAGQAISNARQEVQAAPTAHNATMQAMYQYGNNNAEFLDKALAAINSAKQYGYENIAKSIESQVKNVTSSSSKAISSMSQQTKQAMGIMNAATAETQMQRDLKEAEKAEEEPTYAGPNVLENPRASSYLGGAGGY